MTECRKCGQEFEATVVTELAVGTEPETCPAGGGSGHWAPREAKPEPAEEDAWDEMTAVAFMESLCEDSGMAGDVVADISPAKDAGWLVEDGVALVETADGRRFLVRVQEVNR